jgi:hypothetical protein
LPPASGEYAMLFNILHAILHAERPAGLLEEAFRVLKPSGLPAIVHRNYHPGTPRGPSMEIPPSP